MSAEMTNSGVSGDVCIVGFGGWRRRFLTRTCMFSVCMLVAWNASALYISFAHTVNTKAGHEG